MKTIKLAFLSAIALAIATTSCIDDFTIRGNGIEGTEGRITPGFDQVKSEGVFDVHITNGDDYDVVITAESNILPYIETDVHNDQLVIHTRGLHNIRNRLPIEVFVTTPHLHGIKQSGSGIITTGYFTANNVDLVISGSGRIETAMDADYIDAVVSGSGNLYISGAAVDGDFMVSGSGKIDAYDLSIRDCDAKISGSGSIWTTVEHYLKATISGSGNIFYGGTPVVEMHISGSGNVIQEN